MRFATATAHSCGHEPAGQSNLVLSSDVQLCAASTTRACAFLTVCHWKQCPPVRRAAEGFPEGKRIMLFRHLSCSCISVPAPPPTPLFP